MGSGARVGDCIDQAIDRCRNTAEYQRTTPDTNENYCTLHVVGLPRAYECPYLSRKRITLQSNKTIEYFLCYKEKG